MEAHPGVPALLGWPGGARGETPVNGASEKLLSRLAAIVGPAHLLTDPQLTASYAVDWTRRWRGEPLAVVRPRGGSSAAP